jgi:hypothetical protein
MSENSAFGDACDVLRLQHVRQAQPLRKIVGVIEERSDVAIVFAGFNTKRSAAFQDVRPRGRSGQDFLPQYG